jgi:hypothetical protein
MHRPVRRRTELISSHSHSTEPQIALRPRHAPRTRRCMRRQPARPPPPSIGFSPPLAAWSPVLLVLERARAVGLVGTPPHMLWPVWASSASAAAAFFCTAAVFAAAGVRTYVPRKLASAVPVQSFMISFPQLCLAFSVVKSCYR